MKKKLFCMVILIASLLSVCTLSSCGDDTSGTITIDGTAYPINVSAFTNSQATMLSSSAGYQMDLYAVDGANFPSNYSQVQLQVVLSTTSTNSSLLEVNAWVSKNDDTMRISLPTTTFTMKDGTTHDVSLEYSGEEMNGF